MGQSLVNKILSFILIAAILGAIGALSYVIATPVGERFTEFYILGLEGKAEDYPKEVVAGEEARVIVGIVNREQERVSYRVEVAIDGTRNKELGPIVLEHGEQWEGEVRFTPAKVVGKQKVEFLLSEEGKASFKEQLHLWIDVKE